MYHGHIDIGYCDDCMDGELHPILVFEGEDGMEICQACIGAYFRQHEADIAEAEAAAHDHDYTASSKTLDSGQTLRLCECGAGLLYEKGESID